MLTHPFQRDGLALAAAVGLVGMTFGVFAATESLTLSQAMALSGLTFTGASQFAFVAVIGSGTVAAAAIGALILAARNALYGPALTEHLDLRGPRRFVAAQFVIDETTAMALAHPEDGRRSFWWTAIWLYAFWNTGTVLGFLGAGQIADPAAFGLDAAFPAAYLAMLVPMLRSRRALATAVVGGLLALIAIPLLPAGIPILVSATAAFAIRTPK